MDCVSGSLGDVAMHVESFAYAAPSPGAATLVPMTNETTCTLCDPALGPILAEWDAWRLVLNRNQDLLGKCFLVLRRHETAVTGLTAAEWAALQPAIRQTVVGLQALFAPDHVNYAFLQNQDPHVHLHLLPRYAAPRQFAEETWVDAAFGDHYAVGGAPRLLSPVSMQVLADTVRDAVSAAK